MALDDNIVMPVSPSSGGFGGFGGGDGWLVLLLILFACGGFGGGGFGGGNNIYPWMNQSNQISDGFRDATLNTSVNSIAGGVTSGFGDIQTALCGGFAGVNATINGTQMANMERSFAAQTANTQALSGISSQLSQCCCENRMATVQTQNIVQSEGAATRLAIQNQTQQILDKLCEQEIESLRQANISLQNQLNMANLNASQTAQTQYLIERLTPTTTPAAYKGV